MNNTNNTNNLNDTNNTNASKDTKTRNFRTFLDLRYAILCYRDSDGKMRRKFTVVEDNDEVLALLVGGEVERIPINNGFVYIKKQGSSGVWNYYTRNELVASGGDVCVMMNTCADEDDGIVRTIQQLMVTTGSFK